ncbi:albusnodin family lasso peptide [Streptomyces sp. NPDC058486]|uniref:albusnodin family lasso peptide n=1 Tax=unclassified Streptomyces TaxID=2593676 RepID=UPI003649E3FF
MLTAVVRERHDGRLLRIAHLQPTTGVAWTTAADNIRPAVFHRDAPEEGEGNRPVPTNGICRDRPRKGTDMTDLPRTEDTPAEPEVFDIGDAAELTEGQGGGQSEDKRRAYNC